MPKVSIIIPVYNVEEYLSECLYSVINQTEKDIEIICVEDCSTDSSLAILQEYAKKDDRIIILQNSKNAGQSVARNTGLDVAQGEYVLFVDSDDFIEPTLLETILKYANDIDIVCFNYKEYNPQNIGNFSHNYLIEDGLYSNEDYFIESAERNSFIVVAWSKLYRREFLLENNLCFEPGMLYEDNLFYLQCVLKAKNVYSINEALYIYRIRPGSTMTKKLQSKNVNDQFKLLCEATREYLENDVSERFAEAIENFINVLCRCYAKNYKNYIKANDKLTSKIEFDSSKINKLQRTFSKTFLGFSNIVEFDEDFFAKLSSEKNFLVYGAGEVARELLACFDLIDVPIVGVVVSDTKNSKKSLMGHEVKELSDYENIKDNCLVIIAVTAKFNGEMEKKLKEQGFNNYIKLF